MIFKMYFFGTSKGKSSLRQPPIEVKQVKWTVKLVKTLNSTPPPPPKAHPFLSTAKDLGKIRSLWFLQFLLTA